MTEYERPDPRIKSICFICKEAKDNCRDPDTKKKGTWWRPVVQCSKFRRGMRA